MPSALDFSSDTPAEFRARLGELAQLSLQRTGAFVLLARGVREVTTLDPSILDQVSDDKMAEALLGAWTDEEILLFLETRQRRREGST